MNDFLGADLPIIQSPMAGVQDSKLTIAVSSAGGLGSLPCALLSIDEIHAELNSVTQQSVKPFSSNSFFYTHLRAHENPEQLVFRPVS